MDEASTLLDAIQRGDLPLAQSLLEANCDPNVVSDVLGFPATPLIISAAVGHVEIATLLLEAGASVSDAPHVGATALHAACGQGGDNELVELLIAYGAQVSDRCFVTTTPSLCSLVVHEFARLTRWTICGALPSTVHVLRARPTAQGHCSRLRRILISQRLMAAHRCLSPAMEAISNVSTCCCQLARQSTCFLLTRRHLCTLPRKTVGGLSSVELGRPAFMSGVVY